MCTVRFALCRLGIPKRGVHRYETAIKACKYVLATSGTKEEVCRARTIIERTDASDLEEYCF